MSPRFRKSKPPTTENPLSPAEVQKLTSEKGPKSLVALSTAVALSSIGSSVSSTHDTSSDGATVQEKAIAWKTAYSGARIAIEAIKESSGLCPPLKAVTGVLSVLIKNCDVSGSCS